jgi:hypothetical protein
MAMTQGRTMAPSASPAGPDPSDGASSTSDARSSRPGVRTLAALSQLPLGAWVLMTGLILLLCVLLPLIIGVPGSVTRESGVLLALLLTLASGLRLSMLVASGRPRFTEVTFWCYVYLFAGLCPLAQMSASRLFYPGSYTHDEWFQAMALTLLGVVGWCVGYFHLSKGSSSPNSRPSRELSYRRVVTLGWIGLFLTVAGVLKLGFSNYFSTREAVQLAYEQFASQGSGMAAVQLVRAATLVPSMAALFLLIRGRQQYGWNLRGSTRVLFTSLIAAALVVANPISNPRYVFGSIALAFICAVARYDVPKIARLLCGGMVISTLLIFPVLSAYRYAHIDHRLLPRLNAEALRAQDYDSFQQTMNGLRYTRRHGYELGRNLLGPVTSWIPRSVWPNKPEPTSVVLAKDAGYSFTNLGSPAWLEGFVDFGLPGALTMGILLGYIARRFDRAIHQKERGVLGSVALLYIGYQGILLRGSLLAVINFIAYWAVAIFICSKSSKRPTVGPG